jgi:hypothetical protein
LAVKLFQDANKIVWIRLDDYQYPRTALFLPEKWHFVKPIITNLEATPQLSKLTFASHLLTTGLEFILTFSNIQKPASRANDANLPRTNHCHFIHFRCQSNLTFGYMLISLDPCWQPVASTNTSSVSRTLSRNTP